LFTGTSVVVYCHSKTEFMARFLSRAEFGNMTNGDFAWFTFWPQKHALITHTPWTYYVDPRDPARDHRAYCVVKQVRTHKVEYRKPNMSVCLSVCMFLFLINGHSFERICTKFGMWHPYTIRMVTKVSDPAGSRFARRPYAAANQWPIVNI